MQSRATHKQPVYASRSVVCANQPAASAAGLAMLACGGNVADAAIASIVMCCVVLPQMVSPLGGGYILHREADGEITVIDNRTEGPNAAREDMFTLTESGAVLNEANATGHLAPGTPGALKGWFALHELKGSLPIAQILAPAIDLAEHGFPVSPYLHAAFADAAPMLALHAESSRIFLPGGRTPQVGEIFHNPDLANSFRILGEQGAEYLYNGQLGDDVVAEMERGGGLITKEDLAAYELRFLAPIRGTYHDYEVIGTPLSSAAGVLNQFGFNILENFDLGSLGFGTARYWHLIIETLKLMFAERSRHFGDPKFVHVPQERLLDKDYAKSRAALIDINRAQRYEAGDPIDKSDDGHTTHVTVMDDEGRTVSMTQTINLGFGSRVVVPGTGMVLNDNMASFDPRPGRPNSPGPRKRMLSAMAATIVERDGRAAFALGTPGGNHIFPSIFQSTLNVVDHGMNLQEAVEAPRVWANGTTTLIENTADAGVVAELEQLGHNLERVAHIAGNTNGVQVDAATGMLLGASCWRGDGAPAGLSGGQAYRDAE